MSTYMCQDSGLVDPPNAMPPPGRAALQGAQPSKTHENQ